MAHLFVASEHMHEAAPGCVFKKQEEGEGSQVEERKTTDDGKAAGWGGDEGEERGEKKIALMAGRENSEELCTASCADCPGSGFCKFRKGNYDNGH